MIRRDNLMLLAMTPCCVDFYPQIGKSFRGGNSLNVAAMWKKLEPKVNVSVITCLGNDENGGRILRFLEQKNIDTSSVYISEGTTACNQLRVDDQAERYGIEGT
jgi:sugar/nucleoside kinase (ribokinase family)